MSAPQALYPISHIRSFAAYIRAKGAFRPPSSMRLAAAYPLRISGVHTSAFKLGLEELERVFLAGRERVRIVPDCADGLYQRRNIAHFVSQTAGVRGEQVHELTRQAVS